MRRPPAKPRREYAQQDVADNATSDFDLLRATPDEIDEFFLDPSMGWRVGYIAAFVGGLKADLASDRLGKHRANDVPDIAREIGLRLHSLASKCDHYFSFPDWSPLQASIANQVLSDACLIVERIRHAKSLQSAIEKTRGKREKRKSTVTADKNEKAVKGAWIALCKTAMPARNRAARIARDVDLTPKGVRDILKRLGFL